MPKTSDVGVIVGRFQVHRLHAAHEQLIRSVYDTHRQTVIVLGLSPTRVSLRNPLDFEARKQLLLAAFPNLTVFYLKDEPTDEGWSEKLDRLVMDYLSPSQTVTLYGGRDSFIAHYKGVYKSDLLEPEVFASGTELRKSISKSVKASEDFRAGVIWAAANGWPKVFPTVDVAIWRSSIVPAPVSITARDWLLVRKPSEKLWRFCGGFVDPTDPSYEAAARREVQEETGIDVGTPQYVWSGLVDDWRYREEDDKIMTTLFMAMYVSGAVRPKDDVAEASWFSDLTKVPLVKEHEPLRAALLEGGR